MTTQFIEEFSDLVDALVMAADDANATFSPPPFNRQAMHAVEQLRLDVATVSNAINSGFLEVDEARADLITACRDSRQLLNFVGEFDADSPIGRAIVAVYNFRFPSATEVAA